MAIRKKDRSFEDILKDIIMEEVPIEYITHIQVKLDNGNVIEFDQEELAGLNDTSEIIVSQGLDRDSIQDVEVYIDSVKIKSTVLKYVKGLFSTQFGNNNDIKK